jgi:hypothetical protein
LFPLPADDFLSALTVAVADECANSAAFFSSAAYCMLAAIHAWFRRLGGGVIACLLFCGA